MVNNPPIKKFKSRLLSVAVWKNKGTNSFGETSEFHTVSIQRGYKDKNDEFKSTASLRPQDLPEIKELLTQVEQFLNELHEGDGLVA